MTYGMFSNVSEIRRLIQEVEEFYFLLVGILTQPSTVVENVSRLGSGKAVLKINQVE